MAVLAFYFAFWLRIHVDLPFTLDLLPVDRISFFFDEWFVVALGQVGMLYFFGFYDPPGPRVATGAEKKRLRRIRDDRDCQHEAGPVKGQAEVPMQALPVTSPSAPAPRREEGPDPQDGRFGAVMASYLPFQAPPAPEAPVAREATKAPAPGGPPSTASSTATTPSAPTMPGPLSGP